MLVKVRTVSVEFVGGPRCGETLDFPASACPAELPDLLAGGRYVLSDRASCTSPYRPLYDYVPRGRT